MFNRDNKIKMGISQFRRLNAGTALQVLAVATVLLFATTNAQADYLNLQTTGSTGTINGATFTQGSTGSGTGVFPAFVQVTGSGQGDVKEAYNTTVNNVLNNGSADTHNHEITISQLTTATCGNTTCYEFFLDINENTGGGNEFLSLDDVQIYTSTTPNQSGAVTSLGNLVYSMDLGDDNGVLLNYSLEAGSGKADMTLLVPVASFGGASGSTYVYLYSKFGDTSALTCGGPGVTGGASGCGVDGAEYGVSDGFEEWAFQLGTPTVIPEPSTYALYALGASMLFLSGWWQKRRKALSLPTA